MAKAKSKKQVKQSDTEIVVIPPIERKQIVVPIDGLSPLLVHRFSKKSQQQILDKQMGKAKGPKKKRDPEKDYEESLHRFDDGRYGFPANGLKKAMVRAGKMLGIAMTDLRQMFFVIGEPGNDGEELIEIFGEPEMHQAHVRIPGTSDVRFRGIFIDWCAEPIIEFDPNIITAEQVINLINRAGFSVGLGEWRPDKEGTMGRFGVKLDGVNKKKAKVKGAKKRTKKSKKKVSRAA